MTPYGYTKNKKCRAWDLGYEDVLAIQIAGRKSSIGKFPEKCGVYKSYLRNTNTRAFYRRYWKKLFRTNNKLELKKQIK